MKLNTDMLWIASEICYYLGLLLAVFIVPCVTLIAWAMSQADATDPNYWYYLYAWIAALLMFVAGVGLKNFIYSLKNEDSN